MEGLSTLGQQQVMVEAEGSSPSTGSWGLKGWAFWSSHCGLTGSRSSEVGRAPVWTTLTPRDQL
jgi:hypothetical protein